MKNKILLSILIALSLLAGNLSGWTVMAGSDVIKVAIDGETQNYEQPPVLKNGRVLVPFRDIFEALNVTVKWEDTTQTVTAIQYDSKIEITIGEDHAYWNGSWIELDQPAELINGRTYVPIRFVSETVGCKVEWDEPNQTVVIFTPIYDVSVYRKLSGTKTNFDLILVPINLPKRMFFDGFSIDDDNNTIRMSYADNWVVWTQSKSVLEGNILSSISADKKSITETELMFLGDTVKATVVNVKETNCHVLNWSNNGYCYSIMAFMEMPEIQKIINNLRDIRDFQFEKLEAPYIAIFDPSYDWDKSEYSPDLMVYKELYENPQIDEDFKLYVPTYLPSALSYNGYTLPNESLRLKGRAVEITYQGENHLTYTQRYQGSRGIIYDGMIEEQIDITFLGEVVQAKLCKGRGTQIFWTKDSNGYEIDAGSVELDEVLKMIESLVELSELR